LFGAVLVCGNLYLLRKKRDLLALLFPVTGLLVAPILAMTPLKPLGTLLFAAYVLSSFVFMVLNLFSRESVGPTLKVLRAGFLFGLIFPVAAFAGFGYHAYKGGDVFKGAFFPDSDGGNVGISVELPVGTSLETTKGVVEEIERRIAGNPDVKYVQSTIGRQNSGGFGGGGAVGSNYASVQLTLFDKRSIMDRIKRTGGHLRDHSSNSVAATLPTKVGRIPGAFIKVSATSGVGFGSPIQIGIEGDDRAQLQATAIKIRDGLGKIPGVINADISSKPGKPEIQAIPDRTKLADYGLSVADVGSAMRTLYQGNNDAKYRINGNEYGIRVMMSLLDRDNRDLINQVPVKFVQGNPIFLSSVAPLQQAPALDHIDRRNRLEELQITADLLPGYAAGSIQAQINKWLTQEKVIPDTVIYKPLGQADFQARESMGMVIAFVLGIVLVYMLLASLFDNMLYPLIIQMAQPEAMVGALLALVLTDKVFSLVSFIGLVSLVGLVGKNALLLVDYTNTLRSRGRGRHDALVEAGPTRLRPIMMTTLALILGMLPVALAIGAGSEFRETIGITIIGGMILSTMLTLLVIPCSYTIFDDMVNWIGRARGKQVFDPEGGEGFHYGGNGEPNGHGVDLELPKKEPLH